MLDIVATDFITPTHFVILVTKCESTVQCNACCCLNLVTKCGEKNDKIYNVYNFLQRGVLDFEQNLFRDKIFD